MVGFLFVPVLASTRTSVACREAGWSRLAWLAREPAGLVGAVAERFRVGVATAAEREGSFFDNH